MAGTYTDDDIRRIQQATWERALLAAHRTCVMYSKASTVAAELWRMASDDALVAHNVRAAFPYVPSPSAGSTWRLLVESEALRLKRELTLEELLFLAKDYKMTPEEIEAQRQSWGRQDMD